MRPGANLLDAQSSSLCLSAMSEARRFEIVYWLVSEKNLTRGETRDRSLFAENHKAGE